MAGLDAFRWTHGRATTRSCTRADDRTKEMIGALTRSIVV